jgi:NAD(P)H-dependent FMN reductase
MMSGVAGTIAPRVLVFAGSARAESLNRRLARVAAESVRAAGGEATLLELGDYALPLYNGDLEKRDGVPPLARDLRHVFASHQALFIASPENNASVSALLKNTLDWLSRPLSHAPAPFAGKVAALSAASPGQYGGLRHLPHLRQILTALGVLVLPRQLALGRAHEAFAADGSFKDPATAESLAAIAAELVRATAALARR